MDCAQKIKSWFTESSIKKTNHEGGDGSQEEVDWQLANSSEESFPLLITCLAQLKLVQVQSFEKHTEKERRQEVVDFIIIKSILINLKSINKREE